MEEKIKALLIEYLDAPEAWSDNVMIEVDPTNPASARLYDGDADGIEDSPLDYWDVMDLLTMSVADPGQWEIDPAAVAEMAAAYK